LYNNFTNKSENYILFKFSEIQDKGGFNEKYVSKFRKESISKCLVCNEESIKKIILYKGVI